VDLYEKNKKNSHEKDADHSTDEKGKDAEQNALKGEASWEGPEGECDERVAFPRKNKKGLDRVAW